MDLSTRRRALMAKIIALVNMVVTSATGLVSFVTDIVRPVKVTCEFSPVQEGSGDPSPDNVRPISGWTGAVFNHTKGNLAPSIPASGTKSGITYTLNDDGTFTVNGTATGTAEILCGFLPIKWDGTTDYFLSGCPAGGANNTYFMRANAGGSYSRYDIGNGIKLSNGFGTLAGKQIRLAFYVMRGVTVNNLVVKPMLNAGASQIDYRPYMSTSLPINWQTEAGTVYGGTVTLNEDGSADVVVNKAKITYVGNASESWSKFGSGSASAFAMKHPLSNFINTDGAIVADYLVTIGKDASWGSYDNWVSWANPNVLVTGIKSITTVAAWEAYLAENPLTIVYNLKSSLSYHLDNVGQLQSFLGTNNIWHNMNGGITVEYWNKQ